MQFLVQHAAAVEQVGVLVVIGIAFGVAWRWPGFEPRGFRRFEHTLGSLARRPALAIAGVGVLAVCLSAIFTFIRLPQPEVHDEFSYLLAADTFAQGRLSNPPHSMWRHFESFYILQHPTYASIYPPGQGLLLAAGQVLGGHPVVGVWLGMGLLGAALCWMFQAWLPPRWAIWSAVAVVLWLAATYWGRYYWGGGAVAATGGALVFGALRRLMRQPRVLETLLLGLGLALLANSRPYTGLLASLPVAGVLLGWVLRRNRPSLRLLLGQVGIPLLGVLVLTAASMAYYNYRVTGNPLLLPYQLYLETYAGSGLEAAVIWRPKRRASLARRQSQPRLRPTDDPKTAKRQADSKRPPKTGFRRTLAKFGTEKNQARLDKHTLAGFMRSLVNKAYRWWEFYLGVGFTVPLVMLPWVLRDRWQRFALLTSGLVLGGLVPINPFHAHYTAPIAALVYVQVAQGMRHLRLRCWRGRPVGRFVVRVVPLICLALLTVSYAKWAWVAPEGLGLRLQRACLLADLRARPGQHLVLVRYGPEHSPHAEWVYNRADIDNAKVVWARELGPMQNRRLLAYFHDRRVWLLEVNDDRKPPRLTPYPTDTVRQAPVRVGCQRSAKVAS